MYAPTSTADEEEIDKLYETIDRAIDKRCIENIIMGDFNAKIGRKKNSGRKANVQEDSE